MEDQLWRIFENINGWLRYAEKKNTFILAFLGIQLTLIKLFSETCNWILIISLIFSGLTLLIVIFSFIPEVEIPSWLYFSPLSFSNYADDTDNLLFFGHIEKYSQWEYIEKMEAYFKINIKEQKYLEDLCAQIILNSKITSNKFYMFKLATILLLCGQLFFVLSFLR